MTRHCRMIYLAALVAVNGLTVSAVVSAQTMQEKASSAMQTTKEKASSALQTTKEKASSAMQSMKSATGQDNSSGRNPSQAQYIKVVGNRIQQMHDRIKLLRDQSDLQTGATKQATGAKIDNVEADLSAAEKKFGNLKSAPANAWRPLKADVDQSLMKVDREITALQTRLSGRQGTQGTAKAGSAGHQRNGGNATGG